MFRLKIYREAGQNMSIQDYMVDENHWHFTNFNLKHLCVWHTIDREKLRKVKLVGFTDDDNRTKVLKKSRRDCSSKANWAMNGMKHQNCFIISVARAALCQVDSPGDWGTRKLGAQMSSGWPWSYFGMRLKPFLISQILFVASLCAPWQIANNHLPSTSPPTLPMGEC